MIEEMDPKQNWVELKPSQHKMMIAWTKIAKGIANTQRIHVELCRVAVIEIWEHRELGIPLVLKS